MDEEEQTQSQNPRKSNFLSRHKWKILKWGIWASVPIAIISLIIGMFLILVVATDNSSCFTTDESSVQAVGGDWQDKDSKTHKAMEYTISQFKGLGMSGNNIAAALSIGLRESNFNPSAVNPSGSVKGIWQWGAGGINGDRYGKTEATVEAQVALAIKELQTAHIATLTHMKDADLSGSLDAWDTYFEILSEGDPQRKPEQILANAKAIQKEFNLNFAGKINLDNDNALIGASDGGAWSGSSSDMAVCDQDVSGTTSGLPVKGQYRITGGYPNYDGQEGGAHYGVDFQTVKHTEDGEESYVYSVSNGTVVTKTADPIGGNYVVIHNEDGTYAYYGHAPSQQAIVVNVGDQVKKGQHISHEGQTGAATGIHIHFGLNVSGNNFAPYAKGLNSPGPYLEGLPKELQPDKNTVKPSDKIYDAKEGN